MKSNFPEPIPPGWLALQERAKRAKTGKELSQIIEDMNGLLNKYQSAMANNSLPAKPLHDPEGPSLPESEEGE